MWGGSQTAQSKPMTTTLTTTCAIAGGGPAGMVLGFLLARAGVDVVVLEKHADFLRDFRGDTIHPSTLDVMHELGLVDELLTLPHQKARTLSGLIGDERVEVADFTHLPTYCRFVALMPQWDFLDFLARHGKAYRQFVLKMRAEVTDLIVREGVVTGLLANTPDGPLEIHAQLTIGADGRHSTVRTRAGLQVEDIGAPMDVLWMRLSRKPDDPFETFGRIDNGHLMVMLERGDYWQCAFVIPKGGNDEVRAAGLPAFRETIARLVPFTRDRVGELQDWDQVKLLTVAVDRLHQWHRPGLLCIGDAAHAMSPIGGVGINLAIQDAVATANILAEPLRAGRVGPGLLHAVQQRRMLPTRLTQWIQVKVQDHIVSRVLAGAGKMKVPAPVRLLNACPLLRRLPARLVGVGVRPEHVHTRDASQAAH
jgi:2-polyprenyl-6-methoxyphenol hydroxylase-like FAD-dependent oxidoreductase